MVQGPVHSRKKNRNVVKEYRIQNNEDVNGKGWRRRQRTGNIRKGRRRRRNEKRNKRIGIRWIDT